MISSPTAPRATDVTVINADVGAGILGTVTVARDDAGTTVVREVRPGAPAPRNRRGSGVLDAAGAAVTAGLTDHHLHLFALAAASRSVPCGPPEVTDKAALRRALTAARPDEHGWIRGVGYDESVAGDLTRDVLDTCGLSIPVRIQHRSGALWMFNSRAIDALGLPTAQHRGIERTADRTATGRVWRADDWLRDRLPGNSFPDLTEVGDALARAGVVEVTDATPDLSAAAVDALARAVDDRRLPQRLHLLGVPLGMSVEHPRISVGPYKIVVADSDLPDPDTLAERFAAAHAVGRAVAVHVVSRPALALALAAWSRAGTHPGDRLEHAAVADPAAAAQIAAHGLTVVTQPGFLAHRGDAFLAESDVTDHDDLYRYGSLLAQGIPVAMSSDAPYGPVDPWRNIDAAVHRRTRRGTVIGNGDRVAAQTALAHHQSPARSPAGPPRRVTAGHCGDLLVLDRRLADVLADPCSVQVRHNLIRWPD
ncbi:MAG: amidohydrolase family protein [Gordonia sp. (in: high G+C Gram-positive bacteria)]